MDQHRPTRAPDNPKLLDSTLLNHAWEFAAAGDAYARVDKFHNWMPLYFLYGRSMELAMKAFAIHEGASEKELRKRDLMMHDLVDCLAFVEARGFVLSPTMLEHEAGAFQLLNSYYTAKILEYPLTQGYVLPNPGVVRSVVDRIIAAAFVGIWGEQRFAYDRDREKNRGLHPDPEIDWGSHARWYQAPSADTGLVPPAQ